MAPPPFKITPIREATRASRPASANDAAQIAATKRRILCVFPRYTKSFGTFDNAYPLLGVKAFMPPQGLLTIAAYMPSHWEVRFIRRERPTCAPRRFSLG